MLNAPASTMARRLLIFFFGLCGIGASAFAAAACAESGRDGFDPGTGLTDGGFGTNETAPRPTPGVYGEVFGHSESALFRVDTRTREVAEIGVFQGCTYVADIALDESSTIYGSTGAELVLIENNTARCTRIASGVFPNSLSFVPAGTVDSNAEALVGFQGGDYVRIDTKSGEVTKLGSIGGGLQSSGDIVSVKGGKTFVTVKGKDCADCLAEIDPVDGKLVKNWGPLGRDDAFGLAFWGGELYAFTNGGELLLVTLDTGALVATPLPIANSPAGLKFWGAGSTTSAPTGPVK